MRTLVSIALLSLTGCASWDAPLEAPAPLVEPYPYLVCIAPPRVSPLADAGGAIARAAPRTLPVDAARIARELERRLEDENVFVDVVTLDAGALAAAGDDAERAAVDAARRLGADLVLSVAALEAPRYGFSRRTGWFVPNTVLWFVLGFPSWWVRDRVYDVDWSVAAGLRFVNVAREPLELSSHAFRAEVPLSVSEQGIRWSALVTPPGFYEGPDTPDVLTPVAEQIFVDDILALLRESEIEGGDVRIGHPEIDAATGSITVPIRSRESLARVLIRVDGRVALERTPLDMPAPEQGATRASGATDPVPERVYRFEIPAEALRAGPPALLQVRALARGGTVIELPARDDVFSASKTFRVESGR